MLVCVLTCFDLITLDLLFLVGGFVLGSVGLHCVVFKQLDGKMRGNAIYELILPLQQQTPPVQADDCTITRKMYRWKVNFLPGCLHGLGNCVNFCNFLLLLFMIKYGASG